MFLLEKWSLGKRRQRLLQDAGGTILEVGVGTGINFQFYQQRQRPYVIGIEPSPYMFERAIKRKEEVTEDMRIVLYPFGCGSAELEQLIQTESLDVVVCTLVLCTIPQPEEAIEQFKRWLKPGGQLIVLEHIRPQSFFLGRITDLMTPGWKKLAEGCHLNRATDHLIEASGFDLVRKEYFRVVIPFFEAVYRKPGREQSTTGAAPVSDKVGESR